MSTGQDDAAGMGFPPETELQAMVAEYVRLRQLSRAPHSAAMERISRKALHECGKALGILRRGTFVFENETETALLTDAALYARRDGGTTAVERYWRDADLADEDHRLLRDAMLHARFSLYQVKDVRAGAGLMVRDLLRSDDLLVLDRRLGTSCRPGLVMAMRLLPFPGWAMTSGAGLPLDSDLMERIIRDLPAILNRPMDKAPFCLSMVEEGRLATRIMRDCIAAGATGRIVYEGA